MTQNTSLFDNSIKNNVNILNNLAYEKICKLLRLSTAAEFIELLPEGINNPVEFNGVKLSGGKKQKVALARALAKKGKIIILDETTANFDLAAEIKFNQFISKQNLYNIVIVISHREEILKRLDKIFYVNDGCIIDTATFEELVF